MVTALYIKVRIIYEQVGVSTWSKYAKWIYSGMTFFILMLLTYLIPICYHIQMDFKANFELEQNYLDFFIRTEKDKGANFHLWLFHNFKLIGLFYGSVYLFLSILFFIVYIKFFSLIDDPKLVGFDEFKDQK